MSEGDFWIANSAETKANLIQHINLEYGKHHYLIVTVRNGKQRTAKQNAALHKFFRMLSDALNEKGWSVNKVIKAKSVEVPWNAELVKENLWRPLQEAMVSENSTAKVDRKAYDKVYDILMKHLGELCGVYVPFPSKELE